jgi:predicted PurR-regulated permease PerM
MPVTKPRSVPATKALSALASNDEEATQEVLEELRAEAEKAAGATPEREFGKPGRPFDRHAPFYVGFVSALGVACALAVGWMIFVAGQILVLIGLSFFLAVGLEPAVRWLYRRGMPRFAAVSVVLFMTLGTLLGFVALAIPVVLTQASVFATELPHYLRSLNNHNSTLGHLNARYHFAKALQRLLRGKDTSFGAVVGVGELVFGLVASFVVVVILTVYLLVDMPRVRRGLYQLAPLSRRPRMVLLTDEILNRVGGYVLGNLLTSLVAGVGTYAWAMIFGIPYALFLALFVALIDLIPIIGSTIGGVIVSLVALTVSTELAIATAIFYVAYRFVEDYWLTPKIMARTVAVPGLVTVVATVIGGALLGVVGALVAIPVAAAIKLLLEEIAAPRLEQS